MKYSQLWELACLRLRCISRLIHWLTRRNRGQARSHRGYCATATFPFLILNR